MEIGFAETHQTLVINGLRDRVYLAVDGKIMTGKDVVIARSSVQKNLVFTSAPGDYRLRDDA